MSEALNPYENLAWHHEMGVDETIGDEHIDRFNLEAKKEQPTAVENTPTTAPVKSEKTGHEPAPQKPTLQKPALARAAPIQQASLEETVAAAQHVADQATDTNSLKEAINSFDACPLRKTAANTVFSIGNEAADLMIIGEIPDADEDRQGIPFSGNNGEMVNKMMQAIGYADGINDIYATTALPWRPPGNRKPTPLELESCLPFLKRHIELKKPKCLLIMGGTALRALTGVSDRVKKVRGKWIDINIADTTIKAMVTYHPTYLTKQPNAKKETWADLLALKQELGG